MTKEEASDFVQEESLRVMIDYMKLTGMDQKLSKVNQSINK